MWFEITTIEHQIIFITIMQLAHPQTLSSGFESFQCSVEMTLGFGMCSVDSCVNVTAAEKEILEVCNHHQFLLSLMGNRTSTKHRHLVLRSL
jgi:hypothetical protein